MQTLENLQKDGYFYVTHAVLKSKMKLKTKGMFCFIQSLPNDWKLKSAYVCKKTHTCLNTYKTMQNEMLSFDGVINAKGQYIKVPRCVVQDERLSLGAKALFCYLLTQDCLFWFRKTTRALKIGFATLQSLINELRALDYWIFTNANEATQIKKVLFDIVDSGNVVLETQLFVGENEAQNQAQDVSKIDESVSEIGVSEIDTIQIRNKIKNKKHIIQKQDINSRALKILKIAFEKISDYQKLEAHYQAQQQIYKSFSVEQRELIQNWFKHKAQINGAKPTLQNMQQDVKKLQEFKQMGFDIEFIISTCISRNYRGLYVVQNYQKAPWQIQAEKMEAGKKRSIARARERMANERANRELLV